MPIKIIADPPAPRSLARSVFDSNLLSTASDPGAKSIGPAEFGALPIYNVPASQFTAGRLDTATQTGWRYVRVTADGRSGDVVEISLDDTPAFVSHAGNGAGAALAEVCNRAGDDLDGEKAEFEARVLRLPEIGVEVLWLHSSAPAERDHFYGIPRSMMHLKDGEFQEHVKRLTLDYAARIRSKQTAGLQG